MHRTYRIGAFMSMCLLLLLTACQSVEEVKPSKSATSASMPTATQIRSDSDPLSATQTSCPAQKPARAAVTTAMAADLGKQIVYIYNYNYNNNDPSVLANRIGTLYRYDTTKASKTTIATFPLSTILNAQISADGQWILLLRELNSFQDQLQMVRLDGQGLQTLYCSNDIGAVEWSPDQKMVAFTESTSTLSVLKLLNLSTGQIEVAVQSQTLEEKSPFPAKWLDATHLYVFSSATDSSPDHLYVLDTSRSFPLKLSQLQLLLKINSPCFGLDTSVNHNQLYISQCTADEGLPILLHGPGSVTVQPAQESTTKTLLQTQMAVASVRVVSSTLLLLFVKQSVSPIEHQNPSELANNGVWKMNADGTGLTRILQMQGQEEEVNFKGDTHYGAWNLTSDNAYAIRTVDTGKTSLSYGTLSGTNRPEFASVDRGSEDLAMVGWTR